MYNIVPIDACPVYYHLKVMPRIKPITEAHSLNTTDIRL